MPGHRYHGIGVNHMNVDLVWLHQVIGILTWNGITSMVNGTNRGNGIKHGMRYHPMNVVLETIHQIQTTVQFLLFLHPSFLCLHLLLLLFLLLFLLLKYIIVNKHIHRLDQNTMQNTINLNKKNLNTEEMVNLFLPIHLMKLRNFKPI